MNLPRIPVIPTLLVLAAAALMVRLGFWQLERLHQKEALLARYQAAATMNAEVPWPRSAEEAQASLFHHATISCDNPGDLRIEGAGKAGNRFIYRCASGALVQIGTAQDPGTRPNWQGGAVTGLIVSAPDHRSWLETLNDRRPAEPMLISGQPLAGLQPSAFPNPQDLPNNHLSYAVQWFLFALTALVIYALALRKRLAGA